MPAPRHPDKSVRVRTHIPVLQYAFDHADQIGSSIKYVVEHGMGIGSTTFFHEKRISEILSYEDDPNWMRCDACAKQSNIIHKIIRFSDSEEHITSFLHNPEMTLGFVDGPHLQRIQILFKLFEYHVPYVVEHDSESLPIPELIERVSQASKMGYHIYKYELQNPETFLYIRDDRSQSIDKSTFTKVC